MTDRRVTVVLTAFAAGQACARLPNTPAGFVCGVCVAFLVGVAGVRLLDRWAGSGGPKGAA